MIIINKKANHIEVICFFINDVIEIEFSGFYIFKKKVFYSNRKNDYNKKGEPK